MIIGRIKNATKALGKSQGYRELPIREDFVHDVVNGEKTPVMITAWIPTAVELKLLNEGMPVQLHILGIAHPPVRVEVGTEVVEAHENEV